MYCWKCGHQAVTAAKYCTNCGSPMAAAATAETATNVPASSTPTPGPAPAASILKTSGSYDFAEPTFAGFWRRFAAYVVDSLVLMIPQFAITLAFQKSEALAFLLQMVLWWLYKATMESSDMQATLGKKALGIKVTDMYGERISFARATGRFCGMLLSAVPLGAGLIMAGVTRKRQALHDMLASALVVRASASASQVREGIGTMPMTWGVWIAAGLFVVIPGVGILAAIAIPAYQDYTVRARVVEAISDGERYKQAAEAEFRHGARAPGNLSFEPSSQYVREIAVLGAERQLIIYLNTEKFAGQSFNDGVGVVFSLDSQGQWSCSSNLPSKYLPAACR